MNRNEVAVTVLTPVYNRKDLIVNLFHSLQNQTSFNFEWLIIDDGSTESLKDIVMEIIDEEKRFSIRYFYKDNGGKHTALNLGIPKALGKLLFIVDSDDLLTPKAIEQIIFWEKSINNERICGLGFCKAHSDYSLIGTTFSEKTYVDISSLEKENYNISGDKALVYYTNILKKYPFPTFKNENFLTEDVVWDQIAHDRYELRWINEVICLCEYYETGLSKNWKTNLKNNPKGYALFIKQKIHFKRISKKDKYMLSKSYFNCISDYSVYKMCHDLEINIFAYLLYDFMFKLKKVLKLVDFRLKRIKLYILNFIVDDTKICIISQNCVGGMLYHDLKMKFYSPTINLFFTSSDFIKFVSNLNYYLSGELNFLNSFQYPVAQINDIYIHFLHYGSNEEALIKWNNRKRRLSKDDIIIFMTDRDGFDECDFKNFQQLPYHKLLFTCNKKWKNMPNVNYISRYKSYAELPDDFLTSKSYININLIMFFYSLRRRRYFDTK